MAELVTLLMLTVSQLLGAGASDQGLAEAVQQAVMENPPVPIEALAVDVMYIAPETTTTTAPADEGEAVEIMLYPPALAKPQEVVQEGYLIQFEMQGLLLDPLLISTAQFTVGGVQLSPGGGLAIGSIEWSADIGEEELTAALLASTDQLGKAAKVTLREEGVTLKGSYKALLTRIPFEVQGNLQVDNQTQLMFDIDKSRMTGIPIPKQVNKLIEKEVNPVYDLAKFAERSKKDIELAREQLDYEFYLEVEKIIPLNGHIQVEGTA